MKDINEGMKDIERSVELAGEEEMRGSMYGQVLENAAEEEEYDEKIAKVKGEVRRSAVVSIVLWVLFFVLLIARLLQVF